MNRKEQIKKIGGEISEYINRNINQLDINAVEDGIRNIADKYGLPCHQVAEKNEQYVISNMLFVLGDLILVNVSYDTEGKEDKGDGVDATVNTQVIGIEDKELLLKNLDTDDPQQRLLYNYIAGKDIKDRFS